MSNSITKKATSSLSSVSNFKQEDGEVTEERIMVRGVQLSISSSDLGMMKKAKQLLEDYFRSPPVQYSKETILRLANSPLTREPPVNWDEVVSGLPNILVRKENNNR